MTNVQAVEQRLLEINEVGETLVVRKLSAPYESRMLTAAGLFTLTCFLIAAAITASSALPYFRFFLAILGVVVALVALRMVDLRTTTGKEETFRFDLDKDQITRNGQKIGKASDIDHVIIRRIRREDGDDPDQSDYALVVEFHNTRRFTVTESVGLRGACSQITDAANEIARYLAVPVTVGERLPTEEWMDR